MPHVSKDFSHLLGNLDGFSDAQLKAHFTLYEGYVKKLNEIEEKLKTVDKSAANYSFNEYSELKRRHVVPFNGTYLHQMYFENMVKGSSGPSDDLGKALTDSFGSVDNYIADLKAAGGSTPGWVITCKSMLDGKIANFIMFEHHIGYPVHQVPIMALDCWEHAFMIDYGIKKADYLNAFVKNLNWKIVGERLARS